jgi:hypothetical protein
MLKQPLREMAWNEMFSRRTEDSSAQQRIVAKMRSLIEESKPV